MTFEFVLSEKGKQRLVDSRHLYVEDRLGEGKMFWKFDQNQKFKCPARVYTMNGEIDRMSRG